MRAAAMRRRPWSTRGPPVDFGSGDQCPRGAECLARFPRYSKNASNTISTPIVMTIFALKSHSKCQPQAFIHPPSISAIGAASVRLQLAFGSRFLADLGLNGSATETARCKYIPNALAKNTRTLGRASRWPLPARVFANPGVAMRPIGKHGQRDFGVTSARSACPGCGRPEQPRESTARDSSAGDEDRAASSAQSSQPAFPIHGRSRRKPFLWRRLREPARPA